MNDYIKRKDAINLFKRDDIHGFMLPEKEKEYLAWCIERLPSADVVERKRGEWIKEIDTMSGSEDCAPINYYCSECGAFSPKKKNFCYSCGADMRGNSNE